MTDVICPGCHIAIDLEANQSCPSCGWIPPADIVERLDSGLVREQWRPQIPITTGNDLPTGVAEIIGPVFAMTVRSRDIVSQVGAKLKSVVGGELRTMTEALEQSRFQALVQLEERALALGADAVIGMRFDLSELAGLWIQVCAYGTAVSVETRNAEGRPKASA